MSTKERTQCDENGNITRMERYDGQGQLLYVHVSEWQDGRIIRKSSYDAAGNLTASYEYIYDERGNNTEGTWFFSNRGVLMKAEFVYDDQGRQIEITHFGTGNIATNKTFQSFDDQGKLTVSEYYGAWPDSAPVFTYYHYDETGFPVRQQTEDDSHNILHYELFTANRFGKVAEYTSYDGQDKPVYTIRYLYDEEGKKTGEERYDGQGKLVQTGS